MSKQKFYMGIVIATLIMIAFSYCSNKYQSYRYSSYNKSDGNIDTLLNNIKNIGGETGFGDLSSVYDDFKEEVTIVKYKDKKYTPKEIEALRTHYLSDASENHKIEFLTELEEKYEVKTHKDFFKRQIRFCKTNLDLALVGIGIYSVHKTYEGTNIYVKESEEEEYIHFIRDQVQNSIASSDMNYKAIVFRGISSSVN